MGEIYRNGPDNIVYKAKRRSDNQLFVMKCTMKGQIDKEKPRLSGEHQLLRLINSDYVIKAEEIYEYDDRLFLFLDYMDGKELTQIITKYHERYSEEFI